MADRARMLARRKERKEKESDDVNKDVKKELKKEEMGPATEGEQPPTTNGAQANGVEANGAQANGENGDMQVEPMELPPFEMIAGDRIDPFLFKFQFKNVEYSSGRNKTILCFLVDQGAAFPGLLRGCLEDEHAGPHAEEAFFMQSLPNYDPALKYTVTWYVSSSPCAACASKLADVLKARQSMKLTIFSARLFEWEEPEIQAGLKALHAAGCKLRMMKPLDFAYVWDTFVENEDEPLNLWEDCKENYEYYSDHLADILQ